MLSKVGKDDFHCQNCDAHWVVRMEADSGAHIKPISCLKCAGPPHGREGHYILKYFLTDRHVTAKRQR